MKRTTILFSALMLAVSAPALAQDPQGFSSLIADGLEARVFPLPAMMRASPLWSETMAKDPVLQRLAADRAKRVPAEGCSAAPGCLGDAWTWSEADIADVDKRLRVLVARPGMADALVTRQMRASGRFARYARLNDADLLSAAWRETAAGMNRVIAVYASGQAPRYPKIDSIIFDVSQADYANVLRAHGVATAAMARGDDTVLDPVWRYAVGLLMMNERTDAGHFRPLLGGENAASVKQVRAAEWQDHPYAALLVFGHGPEDAQSRTGVMGHIRLRTAADMYKRGLAPFIIVSGGNVHPNRTPFNEAVEMKRLLVELHGVPADRILIEPHARHTTTNLRNCARLLLAAGFPDGQPALIVSDHLTIRYIASPQLAERNVSEMGVQPGRIEPGPDQFTLRFWPDPIAFHVEVADPLDP